MLQNKTIPAKKKVEEFLSAIDNESRRSDCLKLIKIMKEISGENPVLWGDSLIGFGKYHYKYASGREGDWFLTGFAPRKNNISLYLTYDLSRFEQLLKKLGKHKTGKGCLYIKKLEDIDQKVLRQIIKETVEYMKSQDAG